MPQREDGPPGGCLAGISGTPCSNGSSEADHTPSRKTLTTVARRFRLCPRRGEYLHIRDVREK